MKVVILCGGLGTRLREETEFRPKPLVEIGGRPILWHIMKLYAHKGFREFVLCLGYRGSMIKEYFLNYEAMNNDFSIRLGHTEDVQFLGAHDEQDFRVTLADTGSTVETGERVKKIEKYIDEDEFMLTYGDGLADLDLEALLDFHRRSGRIGTVTIVRPPSRWGVVELGEQDRVRRFQEKPQLEGWVSAGFFVFGKKIFDYLDGGVALEREPLRRLAEDGQLAAYRHSGFFQAMDTHRDYLLLNDIWARGQAPWKTWA
ncbi:MAG: glucose-1-phosphate cytidylyltransferase [Nitrospirae bacterium]|nr:glucose-1-phosphate cytidylyltransferase [Nitrospirota bacterium]